ncbi:hypothetical protein SAMN02746093_02542 [Legionella quinlivanii DSM 21216]|nr:hypothetical protein SAMN02746093_02542 [Legionella quinlivanii DSM 21216]STY10564.1 Uncharacterised protein [Legionella quinlivanii]
MNSADNVQEYKENGLLFLEMSLTKNNLADLLSLSNIEFDNFFYPPY